MSGHDARLVPAAAVAWAASSVAASGGDPARWTITGLATALMGAIAMAAMAAMVPGRSAVGRRRGARAGTAGRAAAVRIAAAAGLAAVAGLAAAATATAARQSEAWAPVGERAVVEGRATAVDLGEGSAWVELAAGAWGFSGEAATIPARGAVGVALAGAAGASAAVRVGDTVVVEGHVVAGPSSRRVAVLRDATVVSREAPGGWRAAVASGRTAFADVTDSLPDATRGLVRGMVTGDDDAVPDPLLRALRVSGLAHLTAVSGAHFAIVAGAVVALGRRARLARAPMALAVLGTSLALAAMVDGGGSVARAVGTAAVAAAALASGRPSRAVPALAAVVTVLLIVAPRLASDLGFALSVAAVASISVVAPPLAAVLGRRVAAWIAQAIAMTVAAQAACLPLLAAIDADVGPWAVAANAVAAPFAVPVTLAGVAALAVAPVAPALAEGLAHLASWAAWPVAVAAHAFAAAPGGDLRWPAGLGGSALAIAAALPLAAAVRAPRLALAAHLAVVAAVLFPGVVPPALGGAARGWTAAACDVGQGDALVVRAGSHVVMIDAGPPGEAAADCLRRLGVRGVDLLVLTHDHDDHVGGVERLAAHVPIDEVWLPPGPRDATVSAARASAGIVGAAPSAGTTASRGDIGLTVLQSGPPPADRDGTAINDSSITLLVSARTAEGSLRLLALGDLETEGQRRLLDALASDPAALTVDAVKVAHHGSAAQDAGLATALDARVALISVGEGNDYGHPAPETLRLYAALPVARTDRCGDILLAPTAAGIGLVRPCRTGMAG